VHAEVKGLLDEFDHAIPFPPQSEFVLLYGPNGVGKTKLLELIASVSRLDIRAVALAPFSSLRLYFDDGIQFSVTRLVAQALDERSSTLLKFELNDPTEPESSLWTAEVEGQVLPSSLRRFLLSETNWRQVGPALWEDMDDGELVDQAELASRYAPHFATGGLTKQAPPPSRFTELFKATPIYFIETQRLLATAAIRRRSQHRRPQSSTITEYAEDLKRRMAAALADNSRSSQELDRTFPRRILTASESEVDEDQIRAHYAAQNALRTELTEIGLMRAEIDVPIPERALLPWEKNVLATYLDDSDRKLGTFSDLLTRVKLLRDVINRHFLNKRLEVNSDEGLSLRRSRDSKTFPPESLSSGEQHELVLFYDLLFNVPRNAIVLIDEPELSLHVAWQKTFLDDITQVSHLAGLRFVIATHSPQIINKWWDHAYALGGVEGFIE
jgi:ABC-type lipoprotein export system ATPase subunit